MKARSDDLAGQAVTFQVDGESQPAYLGDTIAVALYRAGRRAWRQTQAGDWRGLLCGMGTCYDCLLTVDGVPGLRACQVLVREGMRVETNRQGPQ
jgi:predicted molibdopterin-dependent oxidoreductase YjgC